MSIYASALVVLILGAVVGFLFEFGRYLAFRFDGSENGNGFHGGAQKSHPCVACNLISSAALHVDRGQEWTPFTKTAMAESWKCSVKDRPR